ncbi:hypothetical protein [Caenimonas soli]|nr:hypothetical protein [Caenimonas soli]
MTAMLLAHQNNADGVLSTILSALIMGRAGTDVVQMGSGHGL